MEMGSCDSVCDVFTVENVKNADEGGYIHVKVHVGWAVSEGVHLNIKYSFSHDFLRLWILLFLQITKHKTDLPETLDLLFFLIKYNEKL